LAKTKKLKTSKNTTEQINLFENLPDHCLTCEAPFDKKSKPMALTWSVVVREKEGIVRLYCPECWGKARKIAEKLDKSS
jgi:hypothetical protein